MRRAGCVTRRCANSRCRRCLSKRRLLEQPPEQRRYAETNTHGPPDPVGAERYLAAGRRGGFGSRQGSFGNSTGSGEPCGLGNPRSFGNPRRCGYPLGHFGRSRSGVRHLHGGFGHSRGGCGDSRGGFHHCWAFQPALQRGDELVTDTVGDLLHHAAAELAEPAGDVDVRRVRDFSAVDGQRLQRQGTDGADAACTAALLALAQVGRKLRRALLRLLDVEMEGGADRADLEVDGGSVLAPLLLLGALATWNALRDLLRIGYEGPDLRLRGAQSEGLL